MPNPTVEEIEADILHKLYRKSKWGAAHTSFDNLSKSCPQHLRGEYKKAGEQLVKQGLLLAKPTFYGLEVSLNPRAADEIKTKVRRFFLG